MTKNLWKMAVTLAVSTLVGCSETKQPAQAAAEKVRGVTVMQVQKTSEPGAMATPGVPLLTVEDPSCFRLEAQVDESKIGAVQLGESVPVVIDALGDQTIEGKVTQIVPATDPASRTFTVKIDLPTAPTLSPTAGEKGGAPRGRKKFILRHPGSESDSIAW